jgi:high-affinity Fe2+/Pb2+ permease
MDQERIDDSKAYGIWPAVAGAVFAAVITWLMFHLATGFL